MNEKLLISCHDYENLTAEECAKKHMNAIKKNKFRGIVAVIVTFLIFMPRMNFTIKNKETIILFAIYILVLGGILLMIKMENYKSINKLNLILFQLCDPVKYGQVVQLLKKKAKYANSILFWKMEYAKTLAYVNEYDQLFIVLKELQPKENSALYITKLNLMELYAAAQNDYNMMQDIQKKLEKAKTTNKSKKGYQNLITKVEDYISYQTDMMQENYEQALEKLIKENNNAIFLLQKVVFERNMAIIMRKTGNIEEERKYLEFVSTYGNTTYYAAWAKEEMTLLYN